MNVARIKSYLAKVDFPCNLAQLPNDAYLVGGSVRDALLQRYKVPLDLDFVLPTKAMPSCSVNLSEGVSFRTTGEGREATSAFLKETSEAKPQDRTVPLPRTSASSAIATAKQFANLYHGGFVVLDEAREIARVVFERGTLDLAKQEGNSLETDLNRRDFTINAIAYNIQSEKLVDPLGGIQDLAQGILRMVSVKNLEDDPLRLLRAYRQAAQLGFTIEPATRTAIGDRVSLLKTIAAERVQAELNYILNAPQGDRWLITAIGDGLLNFWLPHANQVTLEQLNNVSQGIEFCLESNLNCPELSLLAKLSTLVATESATAAAELTRLKYARALVKTVTKTVKYLPQLQQMIEQMSLREQYLWFLEVKDIFPILIARVICSEVQKQIINSLIERYLDPTDQVAHPQCLVTGNDLIHQLNLKPSRLIGELLTEIQIAQIESKVANTQQAIDFANTWLQSKN